MRWGLFLLAFFPPVAAFGQRNLRGRILEEGNPAHYGWPKVGEFPVDRCARYTAPGVPVPESCGAEAANAFCKMHGFDKAQSFQGRYAYANTTWIITDNKINDFPTQDALQDITCMKEGAAPGTPPAAPAAAPANPPPPAAPAAAPATPPTPPAAAAPAPVEPPKEAPPAAPVAAPANPPPAAAAPATPPAPPAAASPAPAEQNGNPPPPVNPNMAATNTPQFSVYNNPKVGDYPLDVCASFTAPGLPVDTSCGGPSAEKFCRLHGFDTYGHFNIQRDYNKPTWAMSDNMLNEAPNQDRIISLECLNSSLPPEPQVSPDEQKADDGVYNDPMTASGYRVDYCAKFTDKTNGFPDGTSCGQRAADAFCQKHGFKRASAWQRYFGYENPTWVMDDDYLNNKGSQDSLKNLRCTNG